MEFRSIRPIRTDRDYQEALSEISKLMELDPPESSPELDTLDILTALAEQYEAEQATITMPDPIDAIAIRMADLGINQRELAKRAAMSESKVSEIMSRKRPLSLSMIRAFSRLLEIPEAVLVQEYALELHASA